MKFKSILLVRNFKFIATEVTEHFETDSATLILYSWS